LNGAAIGSCFFGQSSFATYALANEENVVPVGNDVDLAVAAPLGCGFQTGAGAVLNVLRPQAGSPFGVFAAGSVGLAALLAAKASGAYPLVVVDPAASRREMAEALGATLVVDPTDGADVVAAIRDHTGGGVESAFDSSGVPGVVDQAVASLASGGTLATVAHSGPVQLDIRELIVHGKSIRGVVEGDSLPESFIPSLLELHRSGRFPIEKLIVRYPFDEIGEALRDSEAHAVVKPVLVF
jgi:aryl-alcohol dehydrogenase